MKKETYILKTLIYCSLFLLFTRIIYTGQVHLIFLFWNIFLAWIPYRISKKIKDLPDNKYRRLTALAMFGLWWLFLPNAPYMLTDLVHLRFSSYYMVWLDILIIYSFSITGLLLGFFSVLHIHEFVKERYGKWPAEIVTHLSVLSCGFGIYLGRVERLNSWDLIIHPIHNAKHILMSFFHPDYFFHSWGFSLVLSVFLFALFRVFRLIASKD
jgi:uncharacterized membrane protein